MKKKLFSILLSLAMVVTMMPLATMTAFATIGGYTDDNVIYRDSAETTPNYFCITNTSDEAATVTCTMNGEPNRVSMCYKINDGTWTDPLNFAADSSQEIELPAKSSIYFKNDTGKFSKGETNYFNITCDKAHTVSGDITTLLNEKGNVTDLANAGTYVFCKLFEGDTELTSANELSMTSAVLTDDCYKYMFNGCTKLEAAPYLYFATQLAPHCYHSMFSGCTSLKEAPVLVAMELEEYCYSYMFSGCTSLTMSPELDADTLKEGSYSHMFECCSSMSTIAMFATDVSAENCLDSWVNGVATSGLFLKAADSVLPKGINGIPTDWRSEGKVAITFDAGYGVFEVLGRPHIYTITATVGEKYPEQIFKPTGFMHRNKYERTRYYYYSDNHERVTIDENSIVSKDVKYIYTEWKPIDPDNNTSLLFSGSTFGSAGVQPIMVLPDSTEIPYIITDYIEFIYEREHYPDSIKLEINPANNKDLIVYCVYREKPEEVHTTIHVKVKTKRGYQFKHWIINNTIIEPGQQYSFNLFDPNVNLECYSVYDGDEVNTSVKGDTGHKNYEVLYEDGQGSSKTIQSSLDLNMFAGRDFYYRYNKDRSLEIWFGDDDEVCQQHYTIKPISQDGYAFNSWTFNGASVPVDKRVYCNLDEVVAAGSHSQAFVSSYSINKSKNVQTGDSDNAIIYGIASILALLGIASVYGLKSRSDK